MTYQKLPSHEVVYRRIRDMVLFGDLAPGQPVTLHGLVGELGVSMTPVREAIRRLTAEGALEFQSNRRIGVPVLDAARLAELEVARLAIEPRLVAMVAERISASDLQKLADIDRALDEAIATGNTLGYMRHNHGFHFTLYRLSGSQVLLPVAATLWLRFGPLSRVICGRFGTGRMIDRHDETLDALTRGDALGAAAAIEADIQQGFTLVRDGLSAL